MSSRRAPALYFNQASPSAYLRGHTRAVPLALAYMRSLELQGARVLNGADVFALELSKSAQATLLRTLGIDCPRSITFNDVAALRAFAGDIGWPALLKPDQGGSGARIQVVESLAEIDDDLQTRSAVWLPDNLFLLQEYLPHDPDQGIVRLEFLGGELLYAMRVKTHGRFNLCPSPVCNPDEGDGGVRGAGEAAVDAPPVEFLPYPEVPRDAVDTAKRIVRAARLDVGGIEYLETPTAAACSTTSTPTRTCGRRWPPRSASIRSSASSTFWWRSCRSSRFRQSRLQLAARGEILGSRPRCTRPLACAAARPRASCTPDSIAWRTGSAPVVRFAQRFSVEKLGDGVGQPVLHADVVDGEDVRMRKRGLDRLHPCLRRQCASTGGMRPGDSPQRPRTPGRTRFPRLRHKCRPTGTGRAVVRGKPCLPRKTGVGRPRAHGISCAPMTVRDRRIRILRIITRLNTGGPAVYLSTLCRGLSPSRYEQWLVTGIEGPGERSMLPFVESQGIHPIILPEMVGTPSVGFRDVVAMARVRQLIRDLRPDIVETHLSKAGVGRPSCRRPRGLSPRAPRLPRTRAGRILRRRENLGRAAGGACAGASVGSPARGEPAGEVRSGLVRRRAGGSHQRG